MIAGSVGEWWKEIEKMPRTLVHNDFNPRNIAFRRTAEGPVLCAYDWELATLHLPQHDLAELLGFTGEGSAAFKISIQLGAILAVLVAYRQRFWNVGMGLLRAPFDPRERRGVLAYALVTSALTVAFAVGIVWAARGPGWIAPVAITFAFEVAIFSAAAFLMGLISRDSLAAHAVAMIVGGSGA